MWRGVRARYGVGHTGHVGQMSRTYEPNSQWRMGLKGKRDGGGESGR